MILRSHSSFEELFDAYKQAVEKELSGVFIDEKDTLHEAMRYSLLSGGKRLRGILTLAFCEACGERYERALPFAVAIEMIHAYSLIHDDLPAMDDDTMRRGKPTNHVVYGEGMAILAGDALLTDAFAWMAGSDNPEKQRVILNTARAAGSFGMAGGQAIDLASEGAAPDLALVEQLHRLKTGMLFEAACVNGALAADADPEKLDAARAYGRHTGLAFQIIDDLLDLRSTSAVMGKTVGKDLSEQKLTWPACVGEETAVRDAAAETQKAVDALAVFSDDSFFLKTLAQSMLQRVN